MRRRGSAAALAVALGVIGMTALPAGGEQELGPVIVSGEAQVGGLIYWDDNDSAKFEEYRDIPEDPFGSLRFLIEDTDQRYYFQSWLDDIAEDDQQYRFEGGRYGRWGISGLFSEIPHTFSNQAVSPYKKVGNDTLRLRPGFDRMLDLGIPADATAYNDQLTPSSSTPTRAQRLEFRTIEGSGEIFFKPTSAWDLRAGYRVIDRDGTRPKAFGFGGFGGSDNNYINVAAPIEERTHEARVDVQYVQETWNVGLNYTGSFFDNDIDGFSADNPLTAPPGTDQYSAVGRSALAPDNSAHLVSISGAGILPTSFPSQLAGSFSWGVTLQNDNFLPVTSNEAINPPPFPGDPLLMLPAKDLDGRVYTINGNVVYTARPTSDVNVKVRYRIYDHNNDTDSLTFAGEAPNDRRLDDGETSIAYRYRRQNALAEATWRPGRSSVSTTLGMVWENWNRDTASEVRDMNEYGPTARVDWRAAKWARLRAGYAFAARRGDRYDEQGGLAGLRKYSQAELLRHRFNLLAQLDPCEDFGVTLTGGFHLTEYDNSDQGLNDDDRFDVGIEANYRPHERVNIWANYNFDYIRLFQKQGGSSGGGWNSKTRDTAHNGGAGVDFVIISDMLDGEVSYFIQRAWAKTISDSAEDFPVIKDRLQAVTTSLSVHPLEYLTLRGSYRWEKYDRNNFHEDFPLYTNSTGDIYLQNRIADYDAHIFSISAILTF
jgi:MtrB/PioB family decaheme-associated outer membrane protein